MKGDSASELRKLFVTYEEHLMTIKALELGDNLEDFIWVRTIAEKLDQASRALWENDYPGTKPQTLTQLREFIGRRGQALESVTKTTPKASERPHLKSNFQKKSQPTQNYRASVEKCPCCSENHRIYSCKKFTNMSPKDRKNLFWTSKLCFNCLISGHSTKECKSKHTCKTCHSKHNSLLHLPDAPKGAVSGSITTNHATTGFASGIVPTAMVPVEDDSSKITMCRAMIDTGSQISLIEQCSG